MHYIRSIPKLCNILVCSFWEIQVIIHWKSFFVGKIAACTSFYALQKTRGWVNDDEMFELWPNYPFNITSFINVLIVRSWSSFFICVGRHSLSRGPASLLRLSVPIRCCVKHKVCDSAVCAVRYKRMAAERQQTAPLKMHEVLPCAALAASNRAITAACYLQNPQVEMVMILLNTAAHMEGKWKCQQHLNYKENQIEILIRWLI